MKHNANNIKSISYFELEAFLLITNVSPIDRKKIISEEYSRRIKRSELHNLHYIQYSIEGRLHRTDGPAVIRVGSRTEWWFNDKLHRVDGPAVIYADNSREYWVNGVLHRIDGPAVIRKNRTVEWWFNDKLHHIDGPALIRKNGSAEWWENGHLNDAATINYTSDWNQWQASVI